jgi:L-gulonolactone oxidase
MAEQTTRAGFQNWAGTATAQPRAWLRPQSESEIAAALRRARDEGQRVKVVGAGHSWSDIACSDGYLLQLDGMQRVVRVDLARQQITVQAGIRLHRLIDAMAQHGMTLPVIGSVTQQSLAGAIATGTHGSAPGLGCLSSRVVALRMVLADGSVLSASLAESPDLLHAAQVHLGALGVLSEVTLSTVPAFRLREEWSILPFADVLRDLPQIVDSAPYVKLWWLPHVESILLSRCVPTTKPSDLSQTAEWVDENIVNRWLFSGVLRAPSLRPASIPWMNRLVASAYFRPRQRHGPNTSVLPVPMPPIHDETEFALPREQAGVALAGLRDLIDRLRLRVNFPAELRFVAADSAWLSPTGGRDSACLGAYIGCDMGRDRHELFAGFERLMLSLSGRPHWGKQFSVGKAELRRVYPAFDRFALLRDRLDPERRFQNDFLRRTLGD